MSLIIQQQVLNQIQCLYKHGQPVLFVAQGFGKGKEAIFFCKQCLNKQTLPSNAEEVEKVFEKINQRKFNTLELTNILIQRQIKEIKQLSLEIDNFKTFFIQQLEQSREDSNLWIQQLQAMLEDEKTLNIDLEMKQLNLNNEEHKLKEHIRIREKILQCNDSFNKKMTLKLCHFFPLDQFQQSKYILMKSVNDDELDNLKKELEQFELNSTQQILNYPNFYLLRGNFANLRNSIRSHLLNWRSYSQNTQEIELFYEHMNQNQNFLSFLFPNFYSSQFQKKSCKLTPQERNEIIKDEKVTKQFVENFQMYLFYLGAELTEDQIIIKNNQQWQSYKNNNNKNGLQRVLSSLSVLNQRRYALLLVNLTKKMNYYYEDTFINYDLLKEEGNKDKNALTFQMVKKYYFQPNVIDENWATFDILTNKLVDF